MLLDIDGVIVRGKTLLENTKDCIKLLTDKNGNWRVPTVFLTNAGNELRSSKASKLSALLGIQVKPDQVIMSHSPLKMLKSFHKKRCLISGQGPIVEIAKHLGFNSVITVDDLRQYYPHLDVVDHKRRSFTPCVLGRYFPPIEAIILFGESIRWETNMQLICDVLMCDGRLDMPRKKYPIQNLPILACNTDMVWMAEAAMPRFGHGVFLHCLEQIYQKLSGMELNYSAVVGKPSEVTYYYAESQIQEQAKTIGIDEKITHLYAIGDNLDTDVYGANIYNQILENSRHKMKRDTQKKLRHGLNDCEIIKETPESMQSLSQSKTDKSHFEFLLTDSSFRSEAEFIKSVLVKTGVFQGDEVTLESYKDDLVYTHKDMIIDESLRKPDYLCNNVHEAVKLIFEKENYS